MKQSILFLEPKSAMLEVVRSAALRGYNVVVFTEDPGIIESSQSPYGDAKSCVNELYEVDSWADIGGVVRLFDRLKDEFNFVGVFPTMEICAEVGTVLREKLSLPTITRSQMADVLNKNALRKKLNELGLSKIKSFSQAEVEGWKKWNLKGAGYFKPVRGSGSAYVVRVSSEDELSNAKAYWENRTANDLPHVARYMNSKNEFHLEEAFEGELLSVEAIASNGELKVLGLLSRILLSTNPIVEMGSCFPYPHPKSSEIIEFVRKVHKGLNYTDGPTHTEIIINSHGEMEVIDFNPRFVGADVLQSINFAYGIKIQEALVDYALGSPIEISRKSQNYSCLQYVLPPEIETVESVEFPKGPEVCFTSVFIRPGSKVVRRNTQHSYLGCYLTVMPSFEMKFVF